MQPNTFFAQSRGLANINQTACVSTPEKFHSNLSMVERMAQSESIDFFQPLYLLFTRPTNTQPLVMGSSISHHVEKRLTGSCQLFGCQVCIRFDLLPFKKFIDSVTVGFRYIDGTNTGLGQIPIAVFEIMLPIFNSIAIFCCQKNDNR